MLNEIGRYKVESEIARGGMGAVFKGLDPALGRPVAIKLLLGFQNAKKRRRFQTEVQTLGKVRHPNVVGIHATGEHKGVPYLVMDWIDGSSLQQLLDKKGPMDQRHAAEMAKTLAEALSYVHAQGVLHRDLKPTNVLLAKDGTPLLTDFGLAKDLEQVSGSVVSVQGAFLGTPGYLPPEQARGELSQIGPRSDVYGLGATLYAMLTGRPPYVGETMLEVLAGMDDPPRLPSRLRPDLDPTLVAICMRCLKPSPTQRYPDARMLAVALDDYLQGRGEGSRKRTFAVLGSLVALMLGAWLWVTLNPSDPSADPVVTASTVPPDDIGAQAERLAERGELKAAESLLSAALADSPTADLFVYRSRVRVNLGDLEGAEADGSSAIRLAPESPGGYRARAHARSLCEDHEAALQYADQAVAVDLSSDSLVLRAWIRRRQGDFKGAIDDATLALSRDPLLGAAYQERGLAHELREDTDAASEDYRKTLEYDPDSLVALHNLGTILMGAEQNEEALKLFDQAVEHPDNTSLDWLYRAQIRAQLGDLPGAIEDYAHVQELEPDSFDAHFERGQCLMVAKRADEALADLSRAIELAPNFAAAYMLRANALTMKEDFDGAVADYRHALALQPSMQDARFNLAQLLTRAEQRSEAVSLYAELLQTRPDDAEALKARANLLLQLKRDDEALADLTALARLRPNDAEVIERRCGLLKEAGRLEEALQAILVLVDLQPEQAWRVTSALYRFELGDYPGVVEDAAEVFRRHPEVVEELLEGEEASADELLIRAVRKRMTDDLADALIWLTWALELDAELYEAWVERGLMRVGLGDFTGGLADYEQAIALRPNEATVHYYRYQVLEELERKIPARESLGEALKLDPDFVQAWFALGLVRHDEGDSEGAVAAYVRVTELDPMHGAAVHNAAVVLQELGKLEEALAYGDRDVALNPEDGGAYLMRGASRRALGQADGAMEDFRTAQRLNPDDMMVWVASGQALREQQRYSEAAPDLTRALELAPGHVVLLRQRADCYEGMEEWALARADLDQLLEIKPDHRGGRYARAKALRGLGELRAALADCERLLADEPEHWAARKAGDMILELEDALKQR